MPIEPNERVSSPPESGVLPTLPIGGESLPKHAQTSGKGISEGTYTTNGYEIQIKHKEKPSLVSQLLTWFLTILGTLFASVGTTCGGKQLAIQFSQWNADGTNGTVSPDRWIILGLVVVFIGFVLLAAVAMFWLASRTWSQAVKDANEINREKLRIMSGAPDK